MNFRFRLWIAGVFLRCVVLFDGLLCGSWRTVNVIAPRQAAPFMGLWRRALLAFRRRVMVPITRRVGVAIWGKDAMDAAK